jgi:hypothetical protein
MFMPLLIRRTLLVRGDVAFDGMMGWWDEQMPDGKVTDGTLGGSA